MQQEVLVLETSDDKVSSKGSGGLEEKKKMLVQIPRLACTGKIGFPPLDRLKKHVNSGAETRQTACHLSPLSLGLEQDP